MKPSHDEWLRRQSGYRGRFRNNRPTRKPSVGFRREVYMGARGLCELRISDKCETFGTSVHHIIPRRDGGLNTLDNCLWACWPCHAAHHKAEKEG